MHCVGGGDFDVDGALFGRAKGEHERSMLTAAATQCQSYGMLRDARNRWHTDHWKVQQPSIYPERDDPGQPKWAGVCATFPRKLIGWRWIQVRLHCAVGFCFAWMENIHLCFSVWPSASWMKRLLYRKKSLCPTRPLSWQKSRLAPRMSGFRSWKVESKRATNMVGVGCFDFGAFRLAFDYPGLLFFSIAVQAKPNKHNGCGHIGAYIVGCVNAYLFRNCPDSVYNMGKYQCWNLAASRAIFQPNLPITAGEGCTVLRENTKNCPLIAPPAQ